MGFTLIMLAVLLVGIWGGLGAVLWTREDMSNEQAFFTMFILFVVLAAFSAL